MNADAAAGVPKHFVTPGTVDCENDHDDGRGQVKDAKNGAKNDARATRAPCAGVAGSRHAFVELERRAVKYLLDLQFS